MNRVISALLVVSALVSTQAFADGDNFLTPLFAGTAPSLAAAFFAEVLRLWLRAL